MGATSGLDDELAALRRRAYGRDADIHRDPDALVRLHELEQRRRVLDSPTADGVAVPHAGEAAGTTSTSDTAGTEPPAAADPQPLEGVSGRSLAVTRGPVRPASSRWRRWRVWATAAVGAAVGAAIALIAVWAAGQPDVTLHPVARDDPPIDYLQFLAISEETLVAYEPFEAIEPWVGETESGARCLLLVVSGGVWDVDCAPAGFDPIIDLPGWGFEWSPEYGDLPDGSFVRLAAGHGAVSVWVVRGAGGGASEFLRLFE